MPRPTGTRALPLLAWGLAAFGLAACAGKDPIVTPVGTAVGNWWVERETDRITGAPMANAWLDTTTSSNTFADFPGPAQMEITCFRDGEPMVAFKFPFKVGSTLNAVLAYRFDDKPGREPAARFLTREARVVIENRAEAARFLDEMAASRVLYVRIRSLNAGRTAAEFHLDGAAAAIAQALPRCHTLPPPLRPADVIAALPAG
jgi:hypothetical protein